jgi:hypothetical protein
LLAEALGIGGKGLGHGGRHALFGLGPRRQSEIGDLGFTDDQQERLPE